MNEGANPFIRVYDAVYEMLFGGEENPLAELVLVGNRITFGTLIDEIRNPKKESIATADTPEIQLIDEGGVLNPHINSSSGQYYQNIGIYVSTGDYRYGILASLINWYIWCNLNKWKTILTAVTWKGAAIVKGVDIVPVQIGESDPNRNRAIKGWVCVWRVKVEVRIQNTDLVYAEPVVP